MVQFKQKAQSATASKEQKRI